MKLPREPTSAGLYEWLALHDELSAVVCEVFDALYTTKRLLNPDDRQQLLQGDLRRASSRIESPNFCQEGFVGDSVSTVFVNASPGLRVRILDVANRVDLLFAICESFGVHDSLDLVQEIL